jgi:hypothetical protein
VCVQLSGAVRLASIGHSASPREPALIDCICYYGYTCAITNCNDESHVTRVCVQLNGRTQLASGGPQRKRQRAGVLMIIYAITNLHLLFLLATTSLMLHECVYS